MHTPLRLLAATLATLLLAACATDMEHAPAPMLVVEGWIDSGDFPVVKLTRSLTPLPSEKPLTQLRDIVETWAKVTVSDGRDTVALTGFSTPDFFPPFVYTTTHMRGRVGHTYHLRVETPDGLVATAHTTIPPPAQIDSFALLPAPPATGPGGEVLPQTKLVAYIHKHPGRTEYYKLFVHHSSDSVYDYSSAHLGLATSQMLAANGEMPVFRPDINLEKTQGLHHPASGTLTVKLATLTPQAYDYWRQVQDYITLGSTPFSPVHTRIPSHFQGPALGYWHGFGATICHIPLAPEGK